MTKTRFWALMAFLGGLLLAGAAIAPKTVLAQSYDPMLVGAGDITGCRNQKDEETAAFCFSKRRTLRFPAPSASSTVQCPPIGAACV
jgi:hypothetical protein